MALSAQVCKRWPASGPSPAGNGGAGSFTGLAPPMFTVRRIRLLEFLNGETPRTDMTDRSHSSRPPRRSLVVLGGRPGGEGGREGRVTLVGAGPGDPDLLTIKALKALRRADVVVHDGLVSEAILDLAPESARRIGVAKRKSRHSYTQGDIDRLLEALDRVLR